MNEWISVNDRLPDRPMCVLVYRGDTTVGFPVISSAMYSDYQNQWYLCGNAEVVDDVIAWRAIVDLALSLDEYTRWMPLPDPPESEGEYHEKVQGIHQV